MFFVDVETTGTDYWRNEIITLSISFCDEELNECDSALFRFRPKYKDFWEEGAEAAHGIAWDEAANFPDAEIEWKSFLSFIGYHGNRSPLVCHAKWFGHYFDHAFINAQLSLRNLLFEKRKYISEKTISTISMAETLRREGLVASGSLALNVLCEQFKINLNHHDAESDRLACQELFKKFTKILPYDEIERRKNKYAENKKDYKSSLAKKDGSDAMRGLFGIQ
jgi:DNA polymerase III epsilon subunit-like protein